jgi:hypothetical protein
MVGANGFEPSTSWSRTRHLNPKNALYGVAYGTRSVISPLLVVPNLYLTPSFQKAIQKLGRPDSESTSRLGEATFGTIRLLRIAASGPREERRSLVSGQPEERTKWITSG